MAVAATAAKRRSRAFSWPLAFAGLAALALLVLSLNAIFGELRPGNAWSLAYGSAAAVLLLGAAAHGIRRRTMRLSSRLGAGRSQAWLAFHLWGGAAFGLLVLMHSGFRLPSGVVTWWLWGLSLWTVMSGLAGRALQKWIPRLITSGLSLEVLYERIPELTDELRRRAEQVAASADEAVRRLHERVVEPALARPRWRWIYFVDITGGIGAALKEFDYLRGFLGDEQRDKLAELERLYEAKLETDAHYTLQRALRWWQWAHVPTSLLLLVFLAAHLIGVLFY